MVFWFLAVVVFLLLVLLAMQINAFASWELEIRTAMPHLLSGSEAHLVEEIKSVNIKKFLTETSKKYNSPLGVKIFSFSGIAFVVSSVGVEQIDDSTALTVPIVTSRSKSCIFIPKQWLKELTEQEIQCVISHEICHVKNAWKYRALRALVLAHINPWANNFCERLKATEEIEADAFAVKVMGKEVYTEFFKSLINKNPDMKTDRVKKRVAAMTKA